MSTNAPRRAAATIRDHIMDRIIAAAVGGSGRRRMPGDRSIAIAEAQRVARLSTGESPPAPARAAARAAAR